MSDSCGVKDGIAATSDIDVQALRRCLGSFVTGVTIITAFDEAGVPRGMTANSFTSVSLNPPLILVCVANSATCFSTFEACEAFTVNILRADQKPISNMFASKVADKFAGVEWSKGKVGGPRLDSSLAILDCDVHQRIPAGDHLILIGRVRAFESAAARPLVFGQGSYISFDAQDEVFFPHEAMKTVFACIAESEGRVMLVREERGWTLPTARPSASSGGVASALERTFSRFGASVEVTFLYSLFEDVNCGRLNVIYRGILRRTPDENERIGLFSAGTVPWSDLSPDWDARMLRRYFQERSIARFGVYTQIDVQGRVAEVEPEALRFDTYIARSAGAKG